ncbi:TPA: hypothetical protein ACGO64_001707 [Streptococcus suis]
MPLATAHCCSYCKRQAQDIFWSSAQPVHFAVPHFLLVSCQSQGLEYDSVKVIITDEIDELITHSIFYTAITRARKALKIYWTQPVERKVLERIEPKDNKKDVSLLRMEIK